LEEEHNQLDDAKHIRAQRAQVKEKIRTLDQEVDRLIVRQFLSIPLTLSYVHSVLTLRSQGDQKRINSSMKTEKANVRVVERKIEVEAKRMATHTNERRERARAKSEDAKKAIENSEARLKSFEDQGREKEAAASDTRREMERLQVSRDQARNRVQECEAQIKVARDSEKNALAPYGSGMEAIIKEVQKMRWQGQQPLGPLGRFVKLKDPRWADALRVNLSNTMVSWAVTDARDRAPLKALLERYGKCVT